MRTHIKWNVPFSSKNCLVLINNWLIKHEIITDEVLFCVVHFAMRKCKIGRQNTDSDLIFLPTIRWHLKPVYGGVKTDALNYTLVNCRRKDVWWSIIDAVRIFLQRGREGYNVEESHPGFGPSQNNTNHNTLTNTLTIRRKAASGDISGPHTNGS